IAPTAPAAPTTSRRCSWSGWSSVPADPDDATVPEPTAPSKPKPPLGLRQHERYEIREELGRGGLGRLLAAHDRRLNRPGALKELRGAGDDARARFEREAAITARLSHPSIVPLHDVDRWGGGEPFYVMKLVSGRTLDRLVRDAATLDERLA